jgi:hypothetical protein
MKEYNHDAMMDKLSIAMEDREFNDWTVKSTDPVKYSDDDRAVNFEEGTCLLVRSEYGLRAPVSGDVLRLFGRGLGHVVRGIGLVKDSDLVGLYRYQTNEEEKAAHRLEVEASNKKKQVEWAASAEKTATRVRALPEPFRQRFEFFMRKADWGWDFGPYELFVCEEAVKIASLKPESMAEFIAMKDYEAQEAIATAIGLAWDNHSGNTFGAACVLARSFVSHPELLPEMHGALCPLVGCKVYGCYASTLDESVGAYERSREG